MLTKDFSELPLNRATILNNATCPYCGVELTQNNDTKEHVIGRRFVPKGSLDGQWNLILRACYKCNSAKSKMENDISAITLAGHVWFDPDCSEKAVRCEAKRKAEHSISIKTGKPVKHSQEKIKLKVPFDSGMSLTFNLVSPPQIDTSRSFELARMHMMAFFYFLTFNQVTKKGRFWVEGFHPVSEAHLGDWGNTLHSVFMKSVVFWKPCWVGNTADGLFKSIIRKHPHEECWSWALEWNKNYRLIGFFGIREPAQTIVSTFPSMEMTDIPTIDESSLRFRQEVSLDEKDDLLFVWNDDGYEGSNA